MVTELIPLIKSSELTPEQTVTLNESEKELYMALGKLNRKYREVIILRKIKSFSIKETAEILEWRESKVKSTLFRAMGALKKQLEREGYEHEPIQ